MINETGCLLCKDDFNRGKILYVIDPKIGLDGESLSDEPFDHFIIAYFTSENYARRIGHVFFGDYSKSTYISGIGVNKDFRRRGIASKMISLVEKESKKKKIGRVEVCPHTLEGNKLIVANRYEAEGGLFFKSI